MRPHVADGVGTDSEASEDRRKYPKTVGKRRKTAHAGRPCILEAETGTIAFVRNPGGHRSLCRLPIPTALLARRIRFQVSDGVGRFRKTPECVGRPTIRTFRIREAGVRQTIGDTGHLGTFFVLIHPLQPVAQPSFSDVGSRRKTVGRPSEAVGRLSEDRRKTFGRLSEGCRPRFQSGRNLSQLEENTKDTAWWIAPSRRRGVGDPKFEFPTPSEDFRSRRKLVGRCRHGHETAFPHRYPVPDER